MKTTHFGITLALLLASTRLATAEDQARPVTIDGVEYRADNRARDENDRLLAAVEARDGKTVRRFEVYKGTPGLLGVDDAGRNDPIARVVPFARGLLVVSARGGTVFLDPKTGTVDWVRDRRVDLAECEVHHRQLIGDLVPIHYGIVSRMIALPGSVAEPGPHAETVQENGGCCVMERFKAVLFCPTCRWGDPAKVTGWR